jgi:hypothetical protein
MLKSNNNLSMIYLFFFLGISLSQAAGEFDWEAFTGELQQPQCTEGAINSQCCVVAKIWQKMANKLITGTTATSCCSILGSATQSAGIPGVNCSSEGNVRQIKWNDKYLSGEIPAEIGNLVDLERL